MKTLGIIPVLKDDVISKRANVNIDGISYLERLYRQLRHSSALHEVLIATDDEYIIKQTRTFAGHAIQVPGKFTDQFAICKKVFENTTGFDQLVTLQYASPFLDPQQIDLLVSEFRPKDFQIGTLLYKHSLNQQSPSTLEKRTIKAVLSTSNRIMYLSRNDIPFVGKHPNEKIGINEKSVLILSNISIYSRDAIQNSNIVISRPMSEIENIDLLAFVENDIPVQGIISNHPNEPIETEEDFDKLINTYL